MAKEEQQLKLAETDHRRSCFIEFPLNQQDAGPQEADELNIKPQILTQHVPDDLLQQLNTVDLLWWNIDSFSCTIT